MTSIAASAAIAIAPGAVAEQLLARDADPRALQAVRRRGTACSRVFARVGRRRRGRVADVDAGHRGQQDRRVAHRARHRAGGVLRVRDRDDARAAHQADRRLHAHEAAVVRRARRSSRPSRCRRRPPRGSRRWRRRSPSSIPTGCDRARTGCGTGRRAAPAARRLRRAEVRPLAQVRLAENHGARLAQPRDDERVLRARRAVERERPGGRRHPVARCRCCP